MRLAIFTSHPIQYNAPLFRRLSALAPDTTVLFGCQHGLEPSFDRAFGRTFAYDVPLLDGYKYEFLPSMVREPRPTEFGLANPELAARIVRGAYDAVVLFGYSTVTALLALGTPRVGRRTKLLLRGDSSAVRPIGAIKARAKRIILSTLFRRFDHFVAAGSSNKAYYERYGVPAAKITVAPFAVDNAFFRNGALASANAEASLGLGGLARPRFLFVGKLIPIKRPLDLLRAFAKVRATTACSLVVVGSGELEPAARTEARRLGVDEDVRFLGFRNQSELPAVYGACDALILPSAGDAWGLVLNEAMASGLAVAATDLTGAAQDLIAGNGFVFRTGDVAALASGLERWARSAALLDTEKSKSLEIIEQFDIDVCARQFLAGVSAACRTSSSP